MAPRAQPPSRVTRNDVARHAGVSGALVSYVVNDGPKRVAPETAARVRAAIDELGYRPNSAARALNIGRTHTLGLVVTDWLNPLFAELARCVEVAADRLGYAVLMVDSQEDAATEVRKISALEGRQVDGLLICSTRDQEGLAAWADAAEQRPTTPTVLLDTAGPVPGLTTIGPDFAGGAVAAVEHLIGHGHRRIGLVTGAGTHPVEAREQGWRQALGAAGLRTGPVGRSGWSREDGYRAAYAQLTAARPPTAIFAVSDLLAVGVLRAAHELGRPVGAELAVVSFDGTVETEFSWPPLTAVRQPLQAMADAAVEAVLGIADDPEAAVEHRTYVPELRVRRSCGCP